MIRTALAAIAVLVSAFAPRAALAAGWHYYDPECPIALGSKAMKLVAMQPLKNIDRVCDALPDTGMTVIALDAPDSELREMTWDIRVLRDVVRNEGGEDVDTATVYRLPPEKHRNGMVNFDFKFTAADKYILLVKMTSDDGATEYVGRHHFTVGLLDNTEVYTYAFFAIFLIAVGGGFAYVAYRKRQAAQSA